MTRSELGKHITLTLPLPFFHSITHPLTYSLNIHSFIHSLTHTLTHPFTYPFTHSLTHSLTHSPMYSLSLWTNLTQSAMLRTCSFLSFPRSFKPLSVTREQPAMKRWCKLRHFLPITFMLTSDKFMLSAAEK